MLNSTIVVERRLSYGSGAQPDSRTANGRPRDRQRFNAIGLRKGIAKVANKGSYTAKACIGLARLCDRCPYRGDKPCRLLQVTGSRNDELCLASVTALDKWRLQITDYQYEGKRPT